MPKILFNATDQEKQLWVELAEQQQVSLSEWLRQAARAKASGGAPYITAEPRTVVLGVAEPPTMQVGEVQERPALPISEREFKPDFKEPPKPKKGRR